MVIAFLKMRSLLSYFVTILLLLMANSTFAIENTPKTMGEALAPCTLDLYTGKNLSALITNGDTITNLSFEERILSPACINALNLLNPQRLTDGTDCSLVFIRSAKQIDINCSPSIPASVKELFSAERFLQAVGIECKTVPLDSPCFSITSESSACEHNLQETLKIIRTCLSTKNPPRLCVDLKELVDANCQIAINAETVTGLKCNTKPALLKKLWTKQSTRATIF